MIVCVKGELWEDEGGGERVKILGMKSLSKASTNLTIIFCIELSCNDLISMDIMLEMEC